MQLKWCLCLVLVINFAYAVPQFSDTAQIMRHYDYNNGLSQVTVTALAQDQYGYVWVGTQAGLNRFDGHEFKQFKPRQQDPNSLAGGFVTDLCISADKVWVGTRTGLSVYHSTHGHFTSFLSEQYPEVASDRVISLDCNGPNVVVSLEDSDVYQVSQTTLKPSKVILPGRFIRNVIERNGAYYFLSDQGLMKYTKQSSEAILLLGGEYEKMSFSAQRIVLISKMQKLVNYDTLYERVLWSRSFTNDTNITLHNVIVNADEVLVATNNGLYLLDRQGQLLNHWYKRSMQTNGLLDNNVITVMRDANQDLWLGTETRGLHFLSQLSESFGHVSQHSYTQSPLLSSDIRSFAIDKQDRLWFGTSSGLFIFDGQGFIAANKIYPSLDVLDNSFITKVAIIEEQLWVTTRGNGVIKYDFENARLEHLKPDFGNGPELTFNSMLEYKGDLLISSRTSGLLKYVEGKNKLEPYFHPSIQAPSHVSSMRNVAGALWFGSIGNGLFQFKGGRLRNITTQHGLSSDLVFMLEQDQYENTWVASELGISIVNADFEVERTITHTNGLANTAIWALVYDGYDHMWVGSSGGLSQIHTANFAIHNFSPIDGIQDNEFNYNAAWLAPDGRVFVGGAKGFNQFYPQKVNIDKSEKPLLISHIELLGRVLLPSPNGHLRTSPELAKELVLNHDEDIVSLQYSSLDYGSEQQQFYYRVLGLSDKWLKLASGVRQVNLLRLEPGEYVVEAYTVNRFNIQSPKHRFVIKVKAPWWWNSYSKATYGLTILLIVLLIMRVRQRRYQQVVRANKKMQELQQRLELSLWASGDELWDWHLMNHTIYRHSVSPRVDYGITQTRMTLADIGQFVHPQDCTYLKTKVESCIRGDAQSYEIAIRVKDLDGNWSWVLDRGKVVKRGNGGQAIRIAGALKDIAQLKAHENALQALNEQLEIKVAMRTDELYKKNQKLEQAMMELKQTQDELIESEKMASLGGLVAGVAHEINTPLGVALTALTYNEESMRKVANKLKSKTLSQKDLNKALDEQGEGYQLIFRNLDRAQNLIGNFKQVAVDQSSEVCRAINLKAYVQDIFTSLEPLTKGKNIEIQVLGNDDINIHTYAGAVYQILTNLLNNSVIHGFEKLSTGQVIVQLQQDENYWYFNYQDNGVGMSDAMLKSVFDPFVTSKRSQGGCGLGMHIVYNLVTQLLKGEIRCTSELDQGIEVKVKVPIQTFDNSQY
ncbi:Sensor histidine kinase RcsC [Pseudoalteromonas sp. CIP111854]|uniref:histidine kinase n=1 Tax=Pseudoalteromonas holothuriae TaxID=2963714 RepID=A0A9W4QY40_9GAMM|nr:two-component regulator propeller domain-containing protein [Pseudoalteromonas sp. CIP111854]CAH9057997.1 Sensor histidine kinase RcsC [Pseudoalteromonas sp. CIP111854]